MADGGQNAYVAWDEMVGPRELAILVFAHTAKDARRMAYPVLCDFMDTHFLDVRVKRSKDDAAHLRKKEVPHIVDSPPVCERCEYWYTSPLSADGLCDDCEDEQAWEREESARETRMGDPHG